MMVSPDHIMAIVACGGQSSRMGKDKSLIIYHQQPQRYHLYNLLSHYTKNVFLSLNKDQPSSIPPEYRFFIDQSPYTDSGPIGGLLSAFSLFPEKNMLYIGCDYPFLHHNELDNFLNSIKPDQPMAFYNNEFDCYEPLIAWYPYSLAKNLMDCFKNGGRSLQSFLISCHAGKYVPVNPLAIFSADHPDDYQSAWNMLHGEHIAVGNNNSSLTS